MNKNSIIASDFELISHIFRHLRHLTIDLRNESIDISIDLKTIHKN